MYSENPSCTEHHLSVVENEQTHQMYYVVAALPRMKGPALLALLPEIPGHCSLQALPDVSPAPLSDERRLDILELCKEKDLISLWDKGHACDYKGTTSPSYTKTCLYK